MPDELILPDLNLPDKKSPSMSAFEQVSGENPDRVAQVSSIAAKTGKPAPFVAAHLEQAKQATAYSPDFWANLDKQYPGTSKWVAKPENMAVSHDDLENLKGHEQLVQDYTFAQELWKAAKKGTASMASGALRVPSFVYEMALTPGNLLAKATGGQETHVPTDWINTPEAKYWDNVTAANNTPANSADIVKMAGHGDISGAAKSLALQIVASAPNQALIIPATIAGAGVPALFGMGAIAAGNAMKSGVDSGADRTAATLNAGAQGLFEGATERFGTFGILGHWEGALEKELGKKTAKEVIKATAKVLAYSGLGEGTEEATNTALGATASYASGVNPTAYEGIAGQMANSFIVGAGSGFAMTGPGALANGSAHMIDVKQAEATRKVYLAMGEGLAASKLRARLPEAQRNFVAAVTKGGPIENIYVDREAAEVYFQSKGIDPDNAFLQMGATQEAVTEAKETGGRVKISMADWTSNVVGTEHYANLADDISFEPNAPTSRKVAEIQASMDKSMKALDEQIKTDEATKTDYEKAQTTFKADQMKLGVDEKKADAFAQVMAKRALYLAKAEGKTVDEVMGDRPTATTPEGYKYGVDKQGKPLVELTPEEINQIDLENHMEVMREMGGVSPIKDAVRSMGGIDFEKVKRDSLAGNMPEPTLGGGIYRKGGKSVSEMAQALMRAGKVPQGWDEIELADAIDKETREEAKFKTKFGEAKYQKLRKDKLYQAANAKTEKLLAGTKVVDAQGKPLLTYHGTKAAGFTEFETERGDLGAHFSVEPAVANGFANITVAPYHSGVYPVYLNIKNPLRMFDAGWWADTNSLYAALDAGNPEIAPKFRKILDAKLEAHKDMWQKPGWAKIKRDAQIETFKELGYDGIVYLNRREVLIGDEAKIPMERLNRMYPENANPVSDAEFKAKVPEARDAYIAFSPDQIINAIGLKNPSALMQLDPITYFQSAWHGSPHDFDKFSLHAIGTGEGAQAYGYGLYFAGDKAVAEFYRRELAKSAQDSVNSIVEALPKSQNPTSDDVYFEIKKHPNLKEFENSSEFKRDILEIINGSNDDGTVTEAAIRAMRRTEGYLPKSAGKLYEVEIPDSDKMLDWDRPLGEQSESVKKVLLDNSLGVKDLEFKKKTHFGREALVTVLPDGRDITIQKMGGGEWTIDIGSAEPTKTVSTEAEAVDYANKWNRDSKSNGGAIYRSLVDEKGSPEAASKFLHSLGIDGIRYADGNSRNASALTIEEGTGLDGSKTFVVNGFNGDQHFDTKEQAQAYIDKHRAEQKFNYVIFDDNAVTILNKYYQAAQDNSENARGFYDVVNNLLVRGKNADASTYWHEFSHYYLDRLFKASKSGKANEEFGKDWATMSKWLGITADQTALTVEQHEQFARGSEAHLRGDDYTVEGKAGKFSVMSAMSGKSVRDFKTKKDAEKWIKKNVVKAPSKELKGVFNRFRIWLTKVYPSIKALNVELPDDVRQVFDRMVAGEDAITKAEIDLGLDKITEGLPEMDAAKLRAIHKEAHDEAVHLMTKHLMTGVKAQSKVEREALAQAVEKDAIKRLIAQRQYKAKNMVEDAKAQAYLDHKLPTNEGIKLSLLSEQLGYTSGDEMAKEVLATRPMKEMVAAEVKRIMDAHDEMETPEKLQAKALELVHSEKRLEMMALERQLIHSHIFGKEVTEAMRERWGQEASVEAAIAKRTAREILSEKIGLDADKYSTYATMERNAAAKVAAALAIKDYVKAVVYKKHQMTSHALYSQSLEISRLREKKMNRIDAIHKKSVESFKDQDSFDQVGMLFMRFGFGNLKRFAPTPKTMMLPEYIKKVNSAFSDPLDPNNVSDGILNIPDWIASGPNKPWRSMTWAEFQDVTDAINNVIHAANKLDSFFTIDKKATLSAVAGEMSAAATANNKQGAAPKVIDTKWDKAKHLINDYLYRLDGVDALTQKLDGYKDGGIWQQIFMDSMRSQADHEDRQMRSFRDAMKGAWAASFTEKEARDLFTKETYYEELHASMPKSTLISMYLNMGALDNREKLFANPIVGVKPDFWHEEFITKFLGDNLTRKECEFAEKARDIINELWPDISQLNLDLTGFEPVKIEAVPYSLKLADGSVFQSKGGYYPLKSDARANTKFGEKTAQREMADSPLYTEQNSASRAMTKTGHTKKRTQANYTLQMDLGLMDRHLRDVIHDINFRGLVFDLRRLLANESVMMAVKSTLGPEAYKALLLHVNSYATGAQAEKLSSDPLSRAARWVGNRVSKVVIVGKVGVITQNIANMALAGNAVEGFGHWDATKAILFRGIGGYWRPGAFYQAERNETLKFIWERSEFMRSKRMTPDYNLNEIKDGNLTDKHAIREFFIGIMAGSDDLTNVPCWLEDYHKQIKAGKAEDEAIRHADLLVSRISGSGRKYDQALITKGSDVEKLFAKFYTFWNVEYANWTRNLNQAQREKVKNSPKFMGFVASRLVFIYASAMLTGGAPGDDEDKKKAWWWKQYMTYPLSFFPVVRDIASPMADEIVGMPSFGYRAAPVFDLPKTWGTTGKDLVKFAKGDKELDDLLESASKSTAYAVGYPNQFNGWFWNAYDAMFNDMELRPQDVMVRRPKKDR